MCQHTAVSVSARVAHRNINSTKKWFLQNTQIGNIWSQMWVMCPEQAAWPWADFSWFAVSAEPLLAWKTCTNINKHISRKKKAVHLNVSTFDADTTRCALMHVLLTLHLSAGNVFNFCLCELFQVLRPDPWLELFSIVIRNTVRSRSIWTERCWVSCFLLWYHNFTAAASSCCLLWAFLSEV